MFRYFIGRIFRILFLGICWFLWGSLVLSLIGFSILPAEYKMQVPVTIPLVAAAFAIAWVVFRVIRRFHR